MRRKRPRLRHRRSGNWLIGRLRSIASGENRLAKVLRDDAQDDIEGKNGLASRTRTRGLRLECRDRLVARDRRKVVEEIVQAVPTFQVVDQVAQGDTRADKDRCSAVNLRIAMHS